MRRGVGPAVADAAAMKRDREDGDAEAPKEKEAKTGEEAEAGAAKAEEEEEEAEPIGELVKIEGLLEMARTRRFPHCPAAAPREQRSAFRSTPTSTLRATSSPTRSASSRRTCRRCAPPSPTSPRTGSKRSASRPTPSRARRPASVRPSVRRRRAPPPSRRAAVAQRLKTEAAARLGVAGNLSMERVHISSAKLEHWARNLEQAPADEHVSAAEEKVGELGDFVAQIQTWAARRPRPSATRRPRLPGRASPAGNRARDARRPRGREPRRLSHELRAAPRPIRPSQFAPCPPSSDDAHVNKDQTPSEASVSAPGAGSSKGASATATSSATSTAAKRGGAPPGGGPARSRPWGCAAAW